MICNNCETKAGPRRRGYWRALLQRTGIDTILCPRCARNEVKMSKNIALKATGRPQTQVPNGIVTPKNGEYR